MGTSPHERLSDFNSTRRLETLISSLVTISLGALRIVGVMVQGKKTRLGRFSAMISPCSVRSTHPSRRLQLSVSVGNSSQPRPATPSCPIASAAEIIMGPENSTPTKGELPQEDTADAGELLYMSASSEPTSPPAPPTSSPSCMVEACGTRSACMPPLSDPLPSRTAAENFTPMRGELPHDEDSTDAEEVLKPRPLSEFAAPTPPLEESEMDELDHDQAAEPPRAGWASRAGN